MWFKTDYPVLSGRYDNIILQVKASKMKVGQVETWKIGSNGKLGPVPAGIESRGMAAGFVDARRTIQGYIVSVISEDLGHFGVYGYVFSDSPLKIKNDPERGLTSEELDSFGR